MPPKKCKYDSADPFSPILTLLDEEADLAKSHEEYTSKAAQYATEKKKFLHEGDLDDEETFRFMTTVALKLELSQNKLGQVAERRAAIYGEIAAANKAACGILAPEIYRRIAAETEKLRSQLLPLFFKCYEAEQALQALLPYAAVLRPLSAISRLVEFQGTTISGATDVFESSRRFIAAWRAFKAADLTPVAPAAAAAPVAA
jgi:hypothetical protein